MNKKGFTLVELLGVLIVLVLIALITTPIVINVVNSTKKNSNHIQKELLINSAKLWQSKYEKLISDEVGSVYNLYITRLYQDGLITTENYEDIEKEITITNACIKITTKENGYGYEFYEEC